VAPDLRRVALLRPLAVTPWRGDGVGVTRGPTRCEVPNSARAPMPVANKTRATTAQTSRFLMYPLYVAWLLGRSRAAVNQPIVLPPWERPMAIASTSWCLQASVVDASGDLSSSCDNVGSMHSIPVAWHGSRPRSSRGTTRPASARIPWE